ncbi:MAG: hypothetical protein ACI8V8_002408, partial [Chitinophagales bacterium]
PKTGFFKSDTVHEEELPEKRQNVHTDNGNHHA